eukprot:COSAG02_NODE_1374_length_13005_cov_5.606152_8_plen_184_part_00
MENRNQCHDQCNFAEVDQQLLELTPGIRGLTANFDCDDLGTQTQSALEVTSGASAVDTWTRAGRRVPSRGVSGRRPARARVAGTDGRDLTNATRPDWRRQMRRTLAFRSAATTLWPTYGSGLVGHTATRTSSGGTRQSCSQSSLPRRAQLTSWCVLLAPCAGGRGRYRCLDTQIDEAGVVGAD